MRCPKCGYISFDRVEKCGKCRADLRAISEKLHGTALDVVVPEFLATALGAAVYAEEPLEAVGETEEMAVSLDEEEVEVSSEEEVVEEAVAEEITMRPTGLHDIDVSDLIPVSEEEAPAIAMAAETREEAAGEEAGGIPFEGISAESLLAPEEELPATAVEEEVVDLSDLISGAGEEAGADAAGGELALDLTLEGGVDEEPGEEELSLDLEERPPEPSGLHLELEKGDEEEKAEEAVPELDLKLELEEDEKGE